MRIFVALLLTTALFVSCQNEPKLAQGEYEITGTIQNAAGESLYLDALAFQANTVLDTAIIAKDGSFTMKGKVSANSIYSLRVAADKVWLLEMDGGKISITADANDVYNFTYKGSQASQVLNKFRGDFMQQQVSLSQLQQQLQQAMFQAQYQGGGDQQQLQQMQAQYNQRAQALQNSVRAFIDTVSSPLAAMFGCGMIQIQQDMPLFKKVADRLKKEAPDSPLTKDFIASYEQQVAAQAEEKKQKANVAIGRPAPDFSLKSPTGEMFTLSDLKGEVILLDFWASWCRPCRTANPDLVRSYNKYKNKGFNIYSISLDKNMQKWVNAIEKDQLTWKNHGSQLKGWSCSVSKTYGVRSIPATFLLDKDGNIIATNLRGAALDNKLKEVFGS